jgi:plastocyanin
MSGAAGRRWRAAAGLVGALLAGGPGALAASLQGEVRGRVEIGVEGVGAADAAPLVVYLAATGGAPDFAVPAQRPEIRQEQARFEPSFLAIAAGQTVKMPNLDLIFHNVFSYSRPNDFDLGLYPGGQSRSVTFRAPGLVRVYCSIHESMSALVYVAPSPWFAVAGANGAFRIRHVPPGRYTVHTWSDQVPSVSRRVSVKQGETATVSLVIGSE